MATPAAKKPSSRTQRRIRLNLARQCSLAFCCDDVYQPSAKRSRKSISSERPCAQEGLLESVSPVSDIDYDGVRSSSEASDLSQGSLSLNDPYESQEESDSSVANLPLLSDSDADEPGSTNEASDCMSLLTEYGSGSSSDSDAESDYVNDGQSSESEKIAALNETMPSSDSDTESDYVNDSQSSESEEIAALNETMPTHPSSSLYEGSDITTHQFDVSLSLVAQRHNLTYACQTDILRLISIILPPPNSVRSTARSLVRKFVQYHEQTRLHRCCGVCMRRLAAGERCSQSECLTENVPDAMFVEVPLDKQLQERFKGE